MSADFSNPGMSSVKKTLIFAGVGLTVFTIFIASVAVYQKNQRNNSDELDTVFVENDSLDSSFFSIWETPEEEEPDTVEPVEKIVYVPGPTTTAAIEAEIARVEAAKAAESDLPASALFNLEEEADPTEELRRLVLASRRGVGSVYSESSQYTRTATKEIPIDNNNDADWNKYGEAKEFASLPVDMSRVITNTMYVQAILSDAVLSETEGRVTARIANNIYGAHGRKILIPAGSEAKGTHGVIEAIGNTRVNIDWDRIITPAGISISLRNPINSSDGTGRGGLPGKLDRRYDEKYGAALLISSISVLTNVETAKQLGVGVEIDNLTNSLDDISKQIITETADIRPVLLVEQGQRILLKPTTDIWFQKPCGTKLKTVPVSDKREVIDGECSRSII